MDENFEQQWAVALKKSRVKQTIPLATQKETALAELEYNKKELLKTIKENDKIAIKNFYEKILANNAAILALDFALQKQNGKVLTSRTINKLLKGYFIQGYELTEALKVYLD